MDGKSLRENIQDRRKALAKPSYQNSSWGQARAIMYQVESVDAKIQLLPHRKQFILEPIYNDSDHDPRTLILVAPNTMFQYGNSITKVVFTISEQKKVTNHLFITFGGILCIAAKWGNPCYGLQKLADDVLLCIDVPRI